MDCELPLRIFGHVANTSSNTVALSAAAKPALGAHRSTQFVSAPRNVATTPAHSAGTDTVAAWP